MASAPSTNGPSFLTRLASATTSSSAASNNDLPVLFTHHNKLAFGILFATGVAARVAGVWDNSLPLTAAVGTFLGAVYGVYVTATDKSLTLLESAQCGGALGFCLAILYSGSVEGAFQSISAIGSVITNQ